MTDAAPKAGVRYRVRIMQAGLSLNGNYYPAAALAAAVPLFDGARVLVKGDREHLTGGGKDVRNLVGRIVKPTFAPGASADEGEIVGELELIDPESRLGRMLLQAGQRGLFELFGLSIDASGATRPGTIQGKPVKICTKILRVRSVDLIVEPGAGGRVLDILEAAPAIDATQERRHAMDREQLIAALQESRPDLLAGKDVNQIADDELGKLLREALKGRAPTASNGMAGKPGEADALRRQIGRAGLPSQVKQRLTEAVDTGAIIGQAQLESRIKDELAAAVRGGAGGRVVGMSDVAITELLESRSDKIGKMLDALFDPSDASVISIRECYREMTGDHRFTGMVRHCDQALLREALGSQSLGDALGDALNRRMIRDYETPDVMDVWRDMVDVVQVTDFRDQKAVRVGGYGDLPKVGERQPYEELVSPGDETAIYAVEKRGGIESVSLEMIANDDMRVVGKLPRKLAQSAKRTLSRFIMSIPTLNMNYADGKALFHADHGNLGAAALSSPAVAAGRLAMKNQRENSSEEKLALISKFLWVPDDLEEAAFNLFRRETNQDADFIQSLRLQVRPVWCWDDPGQWMLTCDPLQAPFIELGFFGGGEKPELFVQDSPTGGSLFANDVVTYKIRHIYGAAAVDFRTAYRSAPPPSGP